MKGAPGPIAYATGYNVYRGGSPDPGGLACFLGGVGGTSAPDDGLAPPPGGMFVYMVTATACSGESGLGLSSSGHRGRLRRDVRDPLTRSTGQTADGRPDPGEPLVVTHAAVSG